MIKRCASVVIPRVILVAGLVSGFQSAIAAPVTTAGAGTVAATAARDTFRTLLGGGNVAGANGSFGGLRREINWDGVPDAFSAPNNLPANFFNVNSPRGVIFSTPGHAFQVSANAASGTPVEFGNINATYPVLFTPFSPERLFTALGSNVTDVTFFLAGTTTPATVSGFGAIFTDVDTAGSTTIQYFDGNGNSLGIFAVPAADREISFLGISFDAGERIARVRITSGNSALGPNEGPPAVDIVAMDDFLYSEPLVQLILEPARPIPALSVTLLAMLSLLLALAAAIGSRRLSRR